MRHRRRRQSFSETTTHAVTTDIDRPCGPRCTASHVYLKPCEEGRTWREHETPYNAEFDVDYYYECDPSYGADADGNRGWFAESGNVEEWRMTKLERYPTGTWLSRVYGRIVVVIWQWFHVSLRSRFGSDMDVVDFATLPESERQMITASIDRYLHDWAPDPIEGDDEPDYEED